MTPSRYCYNILAVSCAKGRKMACNNNLKPKKDEIRGTCQTQFSGLFRNPVEHPWWSFLGK